MFCLKNPALFSSVFLKSSEVKVSERKSTFIMLVQDYDKGCSLDNYKYSEIRSLISGTMSGR